ncbi:MAG: glycogen debranching protein GlgX [Burkholderiales bacterium]|nr:glycogen debranching protein GlgX [Burkholderiales bacterium]
MSGEPVEAGAGASPATASEARSATARPVRTPRGPRTPLAVWRGVPAPLGATWDGAGVNFALYSEHAERVELCLFDASGRREIARIDVPYRTDFVWHCYLPEAYPGLHYGYRVHGPYAPEAGHRFNACKLLLDPYAKMIDGPFRWSDAHFGYRIGARREDLVPDPRDNASGAFKARVVDCAFTWGDDRPPRTPWKDTVLYEAHVKGLTRLHPDVPPALRGTYAGLAAPAIVGHLKRLGVTAVELLPIHTFLDDKRLVELGLRNYWGYNTVGYFAPEARYAAGDALSEFKTMVKRLHEAGLEVILDVVYNHTAEGNHLGPTLSFRGIDNAVYYRLREDDRRYYFDYTGTGNTLSTLHPMVLRLIFDSLRYWVTEMHVDGFRFDLATTLGREAQAFDPFGSFLDIARQDPVLSQVKLIAEPWDLGDGGYQVGNFPPGWSDWNGRYRDAIRSYWKGDGGTIGELASRLSGSSDLFAAGGRSPTASINFITAHDGFTLRDLVSYNDKHNAANGEDNRDGEAHNRSWNCGVEGPTDDAAIRALRLRQMRNFLATLFFSQGVPMLTAGDEIGRTQQGNNNAYCQDNEISWIDWERDDEARSLLAFTRRVIALRNRHPLFRRLTFFRGRAVHDDREKDITWLHPSGREMDDVEWSQGHARCLGAHLSGRGLSERDERGVPVEDDDLMLLLNAHHEAVGFRLGTAEGAAWDVLVDTAYDNGDGHPAAQAAGTEYPLQGRSLALLCRARTT